MPRDERRLSRSVRLRKYETSYKKYMHNKKEVSSDKRVRRERSIHQKRSPVHQKTETKKKPLNDYQKFVKEQSKKDKYMNMRGSERLAAIAVEWDLYKKKLSKRVEKYKGKKRDKRK